MSMVFLQHRQTGERRPYLSKGRAEAALRRLREGRKWLRCWVKGGKDGHGGKVFHEEQGGAR